MKISTLILSVLAVPFFIATANADSCAIDSMGKVVSHRQSPGLLLTGWDEFEQVWGNASEITWDK